MTDWKRAMVFSDRAQRWAERCIEHTARMYSYTPGSNKYYGALRKANEAESKMLKAFEALNELIAVNVRDGK